MILANSKAHEVIAGVSGLVLSFEVPTVAIFFPADSNRETSGKTRERASPLRVKRSKRERTSERAVREMAARGRQSAIGRG